MSLHAYKWRALPTSSLSIAGEVLELRNAEKEGMQMGRCTKGKDTDMNGMEVGRELSRTGASYYYHRQGLFPILLAKAGVSPGMH